MLGPVMRPPPRPFSANAGPDTPRAGMAARQGVDFASPEPCEFERIWGAVARPVGMGPDYGVRLMTPLEVLAMHPPVLATLFPEPGWLDAAARRARALLKQRAEGTPDVGGC